jgi:hypothetical protein
MSTPGEFTNRYESGRPPAAVPPPVNGPPVNLPPVNVPPVGVPPVGVPPVKLPPRRPPGTLPLVSLGRDVRGTGPLRPGNAAASIPFTDAVLDRHGARVLHPAQVARRAGATEQLGTTAYRSGTLLIPEATATSQPAIDAINAALAPLGVQVRRVASLADRLEGLRESREQLADLPRSVPLAVRADADATPLDAWAALQALRTAAARFPRTQPGPRADGGAHHAGPTAQEQPKPILNPDLLRGISLDHLLVGSAMTAIGGSPGAVEGSPGAVEGSTGPAVYLQPGTGGRVPVGVALAPPQKTVTVKQRRPVVAVLDTGMSEHAWLTGVVSADPDVQAAVLVAEQELQATQAEPVQFLSDEWDTPYGDGDLLDDLDSHAGHGTFIAGLVRQVAPDALVRSIRLMHSDGVVYEGDLLVALRVLAIRMEAATQKGPTAGIVDVVSLSLGYFDERGDSEAYTTSLALEIDRLTACGVLVVCAAGNFTTSRPFYPAALSVGPVSDGPPVISVGAWNPNRTKALFSDDGAWVTAWAQGASLVSTYPNFQGAESPEMAQPGRQTLDTDDYSGGFAVWSGTSFAAPLLAASVAELLFAFSENSSGQDAALGLNVVDAKSAIHRVGKALDTLRGPDGGA